MKGSNDLPDQSKELLPYGFGISFKEEGKYYFQFTDAAGHPILFSRRGYINERGCRSGVEALLRVAGKENHYETTATQKGKHYFIIKAGNHKEIARSALFDTEDEMREKVELLRGLSDDVPIYDVAALPKKEERAKSVKDVKEPISTSKNVAKTELSENRPRYKFSVIYYPDSKIWMLRNDFSGHTKQLQTCDGAQIERFLKESLPAEESRAVDAGSAIPAAPVSKSNLKKPKKAAPVKLELIIHTKEGELKGNAAESRQLKTVAVALAEKQGRKTSGFEGRIVAKSLEDNKQTVVGKVSRQQPEAGQVFIPIQGAYYLKPGLYLLMADIRQGSKQYYGSQLVELN